MLNKRDPCENTISNGFGLSVCKHICNQLGGSIAASTNSNGKGSTFIFRIKIEVIEANKVLQKNQKVQKKKKIEA